LRTDQGHGSFSPAWSHSKPAALRRHDGLPACGREFRARRCAVCENSCSAAAVAAAPVTAQQQPGGSWAAQWQPVLAHLHFPAAAAGLGAPWRAHAHAPCVACCNSFLPPKVAHSPKVENPLRPYEGL